MLKKSISVFLSAILIFSCFSMCLTANAKMKAPSFGADGKFTIINLCDCQDGYPASETMLQFIREVLEKYDPDLVILGGDNTVGPAETKAQAISELVAPFVEHETDFTLVFGNHDHEQGMTNDELLPLYQQYGGEHCLAYDLVPELHGCGTHYLPVLSSDLDEVVYMLYMFDSGDYVNDSEGNELGYDCVQTDQINWYKDVSARYKVENGGKVVPAMAFQHIIVGDVYDELFVKTDLDMGENLTRKFDYGTYSFMPRLSNIKKGLLMEYPCPGYYNYGQLDAFAETGDVKAIFSGHDHVNSFELTIKGVDVVNTPAATFNSYGNSANRGCRLITLDENDLSTYETEIITMSSMAREPGSKICDSGSDVTPTSAIFGVIATMILPILRKVGAIVLPF